MFIEVSKNLKKLSKYFPENLYVVGGYVRDKLLGLDGADVDIASSVDIEEVSRRLEKTEFNIKVKNLKLGSILISVQNETYEYTAFRKEEYPEGGSHCPVRVERTDKIEEDVQRRDFSINSIYYCINKDVSVDLYHGIVDLTDGILRANCNDIFAHDGERILRMVRIAGELDFKIDKNTLASAKKYVKNLKDISGVRKFAELEKILFCEKRYHKKASALKKALNLLNTLQVWEVFELCAKKINFCMVYRVEDRFLGLLIDIVDTVKPECLESFLEQLLGKQFGFSANNINEVFVFLAGYYNALNHMNNKEYFFKYFENWAGISQLLIKKSKRKYNKYQFFYQYIIEHALSIKLSDLKIDEKTIQKSFPEIDSRDYTRIMQKLLSKVFDGKLKNQKEDLLQEISKNYVNF